MEELILIKPTIAMKDALLTYRDAFPVRDAGIEGTSWLAFAETIDAWLEMLANCEEWENLPADRVPGLQFVLQRAGSEGKILGMLNLRLALNDYLLNYGGHIGYSIAPSERKKGYGTQMLALGLAEAKKAGLERVLVTCDEHNLASAKVIENNHGQLENKIPESPNHLVRRYWIDL